MSELSVSPLPSDEEAVAIMAAYEALWPKPVVAASGARAVSPVWRFSGRWWNGSVVARRPRP